MRIRCRICGKYMTDEKLFCSQRCYNKAKQRDEDFVKNLEHIRADAYDDYLDWKKEFIGR